MKYQRKRELLESIKRENKSKVSIRTEAFMSDSMDKMMNMLIDNIDTKRKEELRELANDAIRKLDISDEEKDLIRVQITAKYDVKKIKAEFENIIDEHIIVKHELYSKGTMKSESKPERIATIKTMYDYLGIDFDEQYLQFSYNDFELSVMGYLMSEGYISDKQENAIRKSLLQKINVPRE